MSHRERELGGNTGKLCCNKVVLQIANDGECKFPQIPPLGQSHAFPGLSSGSSYSGQKCQRQSQELLIGDGPNSVWCT